MTDTAVSFSKEEFKKKVVSNCKSLYRKNYITNPRKHTGKKASPSLPKQEPTRLETTEESRLGYKSVRNAE